MTYILNIYEKSKYIYSNLTYNGKLFLKIPKNNNLLHYNILKCLNKKKINIKIINAICINLGPSISYTRIRNILSSAKGLSLSLNIPLIKLNTFIILINYNKKLIKNYKYIIFIIFRYNNINIYYIKYNIINNKYKKIINIYKYINSYKMNTLFFINKKFKSKYYKSYKKIFFYKIPYNHIIKLSYKLYLKKKFIKNINKCLPIYN